MPSAWNCQELNHDNVDWHRNIVPVTHTFVLDLVTLTWLMQFCKTFNNSRQSYTQHKKIFLDWQHNILKIQCVSNHVKMFACIYVTWDYILGWDNQIFSHMNIQQYIWKLYGPGGNFYLWGWIEQSRISGIPNMLNFCSSFPNILTQPLPTRRRKEKGQSTFY